MSSHEPLKFYIGEVGEEVEGDNSADPLYVGGIEGNLQSPGTWSWGSEEVEGLRRIGKGIGSCKATDMVAERSRTGVEGSAVGGRSRKF